MCLGDVDIDEGDGGRDEASERRFISYTFLPEKLWLIRARWHRVREV
jgi:hypothetical protein